MLLLPSTPLVPFLAAVMGGLVNVHVMTLLQTAAPPELRGRVQSLATTVSAGSCPWAWPACCWSQTPGW